MQPDAAQEAAMNSLTISGLILGTAFLGARCTEAQDLAKRPWIPSTSQRTVQSTVPASASKNVKWTLCQGETVSRGALCGTVDVPVDRERPNLGTIGIFFELYTHSGNGAAESAILVNFGGPGVSTTAAFFRDTALAVFAPNLD